MFFETLRGAIVAQTISTALMLHIVRPSVTIQWYRSLGLSAMLIDALCITIPAYVGFRCARDDDLISQTSVAIIVGLILKLVLHRVLHAVEPGKSRVVDLFRNYVDEKKVIDDSLIITGAVVFARVLVCFRDAEMIASSFAAVSLLHFHAA
jgi:hypothetical protein